MSDEISTERKIAVLKSAFVSEYEKFKKMEKELSRVRGVPFVSMPVLVTWIFDMATRIGAELAKSKENQVEAHLVDLVVGALGNRLLETIIDEAKKPELERSEIIIWLPEQEAERGTETQQEDKSC